MFSDVEKGNNLMLTRLTPVATLVGNGNLFTITGRMNCALWPASRKIN